MTTAAPSAMHEIDRSPADRPGRRAFWRFAGLLVGLTLIATLLLDAYISKASQAQAAANGGVQRQIAALDNTLTEARQLKEKTAQGLDRLQVIERLQQRQAEDARLLQFLARENASAIQLLLIVRSGGTLTLQGAAQSRAPITQLMRQLEKTSRTDAPVLLELASRAPAAKPQLIFKIAAKTLAPTPEAAARERPQPAGKALDERSPTSTESDASAWLAAGLASAILALGFGLWRWRRAAASAAARLYSAFKALDPKQIGTWPRTVRVLALGEVALFAAFFAWLFAIGPALEELENQRHNALQFQETLLAKQKAAVNLDAARADFMAMEQKLAASVQRLPLKQDEAQLFAAVERLAQAHGLALAARLSALPLVPEEFYASRNLPLQLSGSLDAIIAFVGELQQIPQLLLLGDFELGRLEPAPKQHRFDVNLRALFAPDPEQAAKQKKKNAKGRK